MTNSAGRQPEDLGIAAFVCLSPVRRYANLSTISSDLINGRSANRRLTSTTWSMGPVMAPLPAAS